MKIILTHTTRGVQEFLNANTTVDLQGNVSYNGCWSEFRQVTIYNNNPFINKGEVATYVGTDYKDYESETIVIHSLYLGEKNTIKILKQLLNIKTKKGKTAQ